MSEDRAKRVMTEVMQKLRDPQTAIHIYDCDIDQSQDGRVVIQGLIDANLRVELDETRAELDRLRREREETERALREWCGDINGDIERFPQPHMRFLRDEFRARGLWRDPDAKEQGE